MTRLNARLLLQVHDLQQRHDALARQRTLLRQEIHALRHPQMARGGARATIALEAPLPHVVAR